MEVQSLSWNTRCEFWSHCAFLVWWMTCLFVFFWFYFSVFLFEYVRSTCQLDACQGCVEVIRSKRIIPRMALTKLDAPRLAHVIIMVPSMAGKQAKFCLNGGWLGRVGGLQVQRHVPNKIRPTWFKYVLDCWTPANQGLSLNDLRKHGKIPILDIRIFKCQVTL